MHRPHGFPAPNVAWSITALFVALAPPVVAYPPSSAPLQDLRVIAATAEAAISSRGPGVRAKAVPVDSRLRLHACDRPLASTLPSLPSGPKVSVRIACAGTVPWTVLVPVHVETEGKLVVARRALPPGTVLEESDLTTSLRRVPGLPGCCTADPAELVGQRVRRPIPADAPIALDSVEIAPVIRRGDVVTVLAGAPGFEVRSSGVALGDARQGESVRIRHPTSLRTIHARADSRGVARADR